VTFIINVRGGGPSSGYISTGFFSGMYYRLKQTCHQIYFSRSNVRPCRASLGEQKSQRYAVTIVQFPRLTSSSPTGWRTAGPLHLRAPRDRVTSLLYQLHIHQPNSQTRTSHMVRSLPRWRRCGGCPSRHASWADVSSRNEPRRPSPTSMAAHRLNRMDRRIWPSGQRFASVHDWRALVKIWDQEFAAFVSNPFTAYILHNAAYLIN
jgi:hypothetical protein